jgi:hypothetical protein
LTIVFFIAGKGVIAHFPSPKNMEDLAQKVTPFIASSQKGRLYFMGDGDLYGLAFDLDTSLIRVAIDEQGSESKISLKELPELIKGDQVA